MKLIDHYIYAVTKHLPEAIREEVGLELRSNILDMLPDNPDETQVIRVLEDMGNPSDLAMNYQPKKKYLIGPTVYPKYIEILKLVLGIVAVVFTVLGCLKWFSLGVDQANEFDMVHFLSDIFGMVVEGLLQAALWVTLVFVVIERNSAFEGSSPFKQRKWTIQDLEAPIEAKSKISKSEAIVSICFNLVFAAIASLNPNTIPLVFSFNGDATIIPLFDAERFKLYAPFIIGLFLASAAFNIYKLVRERWTSKMAIINAVLNVGVIVLASMMLTDGTLFSEASRDFMTQHFNGNWMKMTPLVTAAVIGILSIWDSVSAFMKARK